jgi:hypothetical protein
LRRRRETGERRPAQGRGVSASSQRHKVKKTVSLNIETEFGRTWLSLARARLAVEITP